MLETERMRLRRFSLADLDHLVELDSDPEVMRYLTNGRPTPRERIRDEILPRIIEGQHKHPGLGRWAAQERGTDDFLGWFALDVPADGDGTEAELGYRLRRVAWGRGLATEGAQALIRYAFTTTTAVQRIWAETMAMNTASRRVMAKAGLRYLRTFHLTWDDPIPGSEHGEVEYELRRAEFAAKLP